MILFLFVSQSLLPTTSRFQLPLFLLNINIRNTFSLFLELVGKLLVNSNTDTVAQVYRHLLFNRLGREDGRFNVSLRIEAL